VMGSRTISIFTPVTRIVSNVMKIRMGWLSEKKENKFLEKLSEKKYGGTDEKEGFCLESGMCVNDVAEQWIFG
ncbi:MAG: hypothetical protein JW786_10875, partial [Desulfobacterales bacterium]|nr:hypothetical protein [Desulfobacterales bacterium]